MEIKSLSELVRDQVEMPINLYERFHFLPYAIEYWWEYFGSDYKDYSFFFLDRGAVVANCFIFTANKEISFFDQPVELQVHLKESELTQAQLNFIFKHFKRLKDEHGFHTIFFKDNAFMLGKFLDRVFEVKNEFRGVVDLRRPENEILAATRKRFRPMFNWGKNNLRFEVLSGESASRVRYQEVEAFHLKIAGRKTRSRKSWDLQFSLIENNEGIAVLGFKGDDLVSSLVILFGKKEAYYQTGVNDRELMSQGEPLGHYTMFFALCELKKRGVERVDLGDVSRVVDNPKADSIAKFKKGFTSTVRAELLYKSEL